MILPIVLLALGALLVFGGIKGYSITGLLEGKLTSTGSSGNSGTAAVGGTTLQQVPPNTSPVPGTLTFPILNAAEKYLGVPYRFGGDDPATGIDCSRFVQLVYQAIGISLPRTTFQQFKEGKVVGTDGNPNSISDLQIGDVIFVEPTAAGPNHEGLYVGNGKVQESPHTGTINQIVPLANFMTDGFVGIRRYV